MCLLVEKGETVISNVPDLADIRTILSVLEHLGAKTIWDKAAHSIAIEASSLVSHEAPYELVRKMRASFMVMGPLLARLRKARVSLPGGCVLGPRPIDFHLRAFSAMGAAIKEEKGYVEATAEKLKGTTIHFDKPSHTGTENVMMAACLAAGRTTIINAACDPEVVDLADFLNKAGAKISGAGNNVIEIEGVKKLKPVEYSVMPDRLEAGISTEDFRVLVLPMATCLSEAQVEAIREFVEAAPHHIARLQAADRAGDIAHKADGVPDAGRLLEPTAHNGFLKLR